MPRRPIELQVFSPFRALVSRRWLRRVVTEALAAADPGGGEGASVVIADDVTLHELNSRYRGVDEATDVLAFAGSEPTGPSFPPFPEGEESLGEVLVSYPQAVRQARQHGWPVEREVALLVVHGVLHLLGHDHEEPEEEAAMKELEKCALDRVFSSLPSITSG